MPFTNPMVSRWISVVTPGGLVRYRIGSPWFLKRVPWKRDGMNPEEKFVVPPDVPFPDVRTTKPGRFCDSLPRP